MTRNRSSYHTLSTYKCPDCYTDKPAEEFYPPTKRLITVGKQPRRRPICNDCSNRRQAEVNQEKRDLLIGNRALASLPSIIRKIGDSPLGAGALVTQIAHIIADNYKDTPMLSEVFLEAYRERMERHNRRYRA